MKESFPGVENELSNSQPAAEMSPPLKRHKSDTLRQHERFLKEAGHQYESDNLHPVSTHSWHDQCIVL